VATGADLDAARYVLEQWSKWLLCGGGYAHRSSIDQFRDGFGLSSGYPGGGLPLDVEPGHLVRCAARAMQYLRSLDGRSAELLTRIYLEQQPIWHLADQEQVSIGIVKDQRRVAERAFYALYAEIRFPIQGDVSRFETS
jgi:hypothetical protein